MVDIEEVRQALWGCPSMKKVIKNLDHQRRLRGHNAPKDSKDNLFNAIQLHDQYLNKHSDFREQWVEFPVTWTSTIDEENEEKPLNPLCVVRFGLHGFGGEEGGEEDTLIWIIMPFTDFYLREAHKQFQQKNSPGFRGYLLGSNEMLE